MLRRKPTRLEIKPEDKEEYEEMQKRKADLSQQGGGAKHKYDTNEKVKSTAQRIGLDPKPETMGQLEIESRCESGLENGVPVPADNLEVEVKLQLADTSAHAALLTLLDKEGERHGSILQDNYFFDGAHEELSSQKLILRIRFDNEHDRCVLCLKGKAQVDESGISRAFEEEVDIDPAVGWMCVKDVSALETCDVPLMVKIRDKYRCPSFESIGDFKNTRVSFKWKAFHLEVDQTRFEFGDAYELECETRDATSASAILRDLLSTNGIAFSPSRTTKFQKLMRKTLQ